MGTYRSSSDFAALGAQVAARLPDALVFTRADLRALGVDETVIRPMLRRGAWVRLHHGVYADGERIANAAPADLDLIRCAAAQHTLDVPAHAFGPTAALAHGLPVDRNLLGGVHLVRKPGHDSRALARRITSPSRLSGVHLHAHHVRTAPENHRGVTTVDLAHAAVSTALFSDVDWGVVTADAAAWRQPDLLPLLAEVGERFAHIRGAGAMTEALGLVRFGAQTPLETLSRLRLMRCGIEEPQLQVVLRTGGSDVAVVDMLWRTRRVVGEADGLVKYLDRDALVAEKIREDRIRDLGFRVVRWTWDEIMTAPHEVARRIETASRSTEAEVRILRGRSGRKGPSEGGQLTGRPA